jgi:hypothetical protein
VAHPQPAPPHPERPLLHLDGLGCGEAFSVANASIDALWLVNVMYRARASTRSSLNWIGPILRTSMRMQA